MTFRKIGLALVVLAATGSGGAAEQVELGLGPGIEGWAIRATIDRYLASAPGRGAAAALARDAKVPDGARAVRELLARICWTPFTLEDARLRALAAAGASGGGLARLGAATDAAVFGGSGPPPAALRATVRMILGSAGSAFRTEGAMAQSHARLLADEAHYLRGAGLRRLGARLRRLAALVGVAGEARRRGGGAGGR